MHMQVEILLTYCYHSRINRLKSSHISKFHEPNNLLHDLSFGMNWGRGSGERGSLQREFSNLLISFRNKPDSSVETMPFP